MPEVVIEPDLLGLSVAAISLLGLLAGLYVWLKRSAIPCPASGDLASDEEKWQALWLEIAQLTTDRRIQVFNSVNWLWFTFSCQDQLLHGKPGAGKVAGPLEGKHL